MITPYEVRTRLEKRIGLFEDAFGCHEDKLRARVFDSSDHVYIALGAATSSRWPDSAYIVLKAMYWMMTIRTEPEGWWSELGVLIYLLNVRGELKPGTYDIWVSSSGEEKAATMMREWLDDAKLWTEEVRTWPTEDWALVRDWLTVANEWWFVKNRIPFYGQAALAFWSEEHEWEARALQNES